MGNQKSRCTWLLPGQSCLAGAAQVQVFADKARPPLAWGRGSPSPLFSLALLAWGGFLLSALESKEPLILEEPAFPDFDLPGIRSVCTLRRALYI